MPEENVIIQLSIFVNNEPGRLAAIARTLKESRVNMKAFNLAESAEFGILRAIVDDPEESFEKIRQKGIIVKKTQVIGIVINDAPGSL
ncbi:MAG: amino acid-binding protein, partial [Candidatus Methanomethylophilaceae archaeon]|nr:amino acid-binding protein [Candidatus Methanomethylophilaceae archaeon]